MIRDPAHPLHLVAGLLVWAMWFVVIYGGLSVACAVTPSADPGTPLTAINAALVALSVGVMLALALAALGCWRHARRDVHPETRFRSRVSAALYAFSAGATLAVGAPIMVLPPCV